MPADRTDVSRYDRCTRHFCACPRARDRTVCMYICAQRMRKIVWKQSRARALPWPLGLLWRPVLIEQVRRNGYTRIKRWDKRFHYSFTALCTASNRALFSVPTYFERKAAEQWQKVAMSYNKGFGENGTTKVFCHEANQLARTKLLHEIKIVRKIDNFV